MHDFQLPLDGLELRVADIFELFAVLARALGAEAPALPIEKTSEGSHPDAGEWEGTSGDTRFWAHCEVQDWGPPSGEYRKLNQQLDVSGATIEVAGGLPIRYLDLKCSFEDPAAFIVVRDAAIDHFGASHDRSWRPKCVAPNAKTLADAGREDLARKLVESALEAERAADGDQFGEPLRAVAEEYGVKVERPSKEPVEPRGAGPSAGAPIESTLESPDEPEHIPSYRHVGSFECDGALVFASVAFHDEPFDESAFEAATMDVIAGGHNQVEAVDVAQIDVQPGLWDVYVGDGDTPREVIVQHRNNATVAARDLEHIGGLTLPKPTFFVANIASRGDVDPGARAPSVHAWGCVASIEVDDAYEFVTHVGPKTKTARVRKLQIQSGLGE